MKKIRFITNIQKLLMLIWALLLLGQSQPAIAELYSESGDIPSITNPGVPPNDNDAFDVNIMKVDRSRFPLITIHASVIQSNGQPINDFNKYNFQIYENSIKARSFELIAKEREYVNMWFVIDAGEPMSYPLYPDHEVPQQIDMTSLVMEEVLGNSSEKEKIGLSIVNAQPQHSFLSPDRDYLQGLIDSISTANDTVTLLPEISTAIDKLNPELQPKALMVIASGYFPDGYSYDSDRSQVIADAKAKGIPVNIIDLSGNNTVLQEVATQTGGLYMNDVTSVDQLYEAYGYVRDIASKTITIQYYSPDETSTVTTRDIALQVFNNTYNDFGYKTYTTGNNQIEISLEPGTLGFINTGVQPDTDLSINATITNCGSYVTLHYASPDVNDFEWGSTNPEAINGDSYTFTIPNEYVQEPYVDFYIKATNDDDVVFSPEQYEEFKWSIAVQGNSPASITHTPVEDALYGYELLFNDTITDNTNEIVEVNLFYKKNGDISYTSIPMGTTNFVDRYECVIPAKETECEEIHYFIQAIDDNEHKTYKGFPDDPFVIEIEDLGDYVITDPRDPSPAEIIDSIGQGEVYTKFNTLRAVAYRINNFSSQNFRANIDIVIDESIHGEGPHNIVIENSPVTFTKAVRLQNPSKLKEVTISTESDIEHCIIIYPDAANEKRSYMTNIKFFRTNSTSYAYNSVIYVRDFYSMTMTDLEFKLEGAHGTVGNKLYGVHADGPYWEPNALTVINCTFQQNDVYCNPYVTGIYAAGADVRVYDSKFYDLARGVHIDTSHENTIGRGCYFHWNREKIIAAETYYGVYFDAACTNNLVGEKSGGVFFEATGDQPTCNYNIIGVYNPNNLNSHNAFFNNRSVGLTKLYDCVSSGPYIESSNAYSFSGRDAGTNGYVELFMTTNNSNAFERVGYGVADANGYWDITADHVDCGYQYIATTTSSDMNTSELGNLYTFNTCNEWYVATDGDDENNPGTEELPFASIGKAIDVATTGEVVIVKQGTYYETLLITEEIKVVSYDIYKNNDYTEIPNTIISGSIAHAQDQLADNCVLTVSDVSSQCEIAGFTIADGYGRGVSGGGITLHDNAIPSLKHLVIRDCSTTLFGGGIYVDKTSALNLSYSKVAHNKANHQFGGGIYIMGNLSVGSQLINCQITNNNSKAYGGGICFTGYYDAICQPLNMYHVTIADNEVFELKQITDTDTDSGSSDSKDDKGAGFYGQYVSVDIENSIIYDNSGGRDISFHNGSTTNTIDLTYSCIDQMYDFAGSNCFVADPVFLYFGDENYKLSNCESPCINTGKLSEVYYDLNRDPRPDPGNSLPDLGALESKLNYPGIPEFSMLKCYCEYSNPVPLTAIPSGGIFYGEGVIDGVFYPSIVTSTDSVAIMYTFVDYGGCEVTAVFNTFVHRNEITFNISDADCGPYGLGTITAVIDPSISYEAFWTGDHITGTYQGNSITMPAGNYQYHFTNTSCGGCEEEVYEHTIVVPDLNVEVKGNNTCQQPTANVTIEATTTLSDGSQPLSSYTFTWYELIGNNYTQFHTETNSSGESSQTLTSELYLVEVTDNTHGCFVSRHFEVKASEPIVITTSTTLCSCHGIADGTATAYTTGGKMPHQFEWVNDNGDVVGSSATCTDLAAGDYTVYVIGVDNCTASAEVTVEEPDPLGWGGNVTVNGCTATCNPTGGTQPYFFIWQWRGRKNIWEYFSNTNSSTIYDLQPGAYRVRFTDANGCEESSWKTFYIVDNLTHEYDFVFRFTGTYEPETYEYTQEVNYEVNKTQDALISQLEKCKQRLKSEAVGFAADSCLNPNIEDTLMVKTQEHYYHHTLYYYDRAGNLVQTVPPEGVDNSNTASSHPSHTMKTQYAYNTVGQLMEQTTPDGGTTQFWYNSVGQLRLSQNAQHALDNKQAYSKYDELGRVIETGITAETPSFTDSLDIDAFPRSNNLEQVYTVYTNPAAYTYYGEPQTFTLNRVSYSHTADGIVTTYSYDPHGNVEWIVQHIPGLGDNYIRYEYDLISGKVTEVAYNEFNEDRFFHRYGYDEDNRIISCETSRDHVIWDKDAGYDYFAHGPLKRTDIGEDKIQGLDYTYTLQGWLKAINNASSDASDDPGADGTTGAKTAADAFGMTLGYYDNDFVNNNFATVFDNSYQTNELYNGNISSWSFRNSTISGETQTYADEVLGFEYSYDYLNRIKSSDMFLQGTTNWTAKTDYHADYSYDKNGNITNLKRKTSLNNNGLSVDDLGYTYANGTNKLTSVTDAVTLIDDYNDITGTTNYQYDAIGNLSNESSSDYNLDISWTAYGKVDRVLRTNSDASITVIDFTYDATGNRVRKDVYDAATWPLEMVSSFYIRDASGNIMAVYDRTVAGDQTKQGISWKLKERPVYGSSRIGVDKTEFFTGEVDVTGYSAEDDTIYVEKPVFNTYNEAVVSENSAFANWIIPSLYEVPNPPYTRLNRHYFTGTGSAQLGVSANYDMNRNLSMYVSDNRALIAYAFSNTASPTKTYLGFDTQAPTEQTGFTMDPDAQSIIIKAPEESDTYYLIYRGTKGSLKAEKFNPEKKAVESSHTLDSHDGIGYSFAALEVDEYEEKAYLFYTSYENDALEPEDQDIWLKVIEFSNGTFSSPVTLSTKVGVDSREIGEIQLSADGNYIAWMAKSRLEKSATARRIFVEKLNNDYLSTESYDELNVESLDPDNHISLDFAPDGRHLIFSLENCASSSDDGLYAYNFANLEDYEQISTSVTGAIRKTYNGDIAVAKAGGTSLYSLADGDPDNLLLSKSINTENLTGLLPIQVVRINYEYPEPLLAHRQVGKKRYELTDHLGNVRSVVSDEKTTTLTVAGAVGTFEATVKQANDYYPFGSLLYGRDVSVSSEDYRFGFNGKESDSEWHNASGSIYDYGFRIYNPRIGKFLSVDPISRSYPWYTPYQFAGNKPIANIDLDGLEEWYYLDAGEWKVSDETGPLSDDYRKETGLYSSEEIVEIEMGWHLIHLQNEVSSILAERNAKAIQSRNEFIRLQNPFYLMYQMSPAKGAVDTYFHASEGEYTAAVIIGALTLLDLNQLKGATKLLRGELEVGTYKELLKKGSKGDNLTPHHAPSAAHMKKMGVHKNDAIAINMEHPLPGKGGRHRQTITYGTTYDVDMISRDALAVNIRNLRQIYTQHGLYSRETNEALTKLIYENKRKFPEIFGK